MAPMVSTKGVSAEKECGKGVRLLSWKSSLTLFPAQGPASHAPTHVGHVVGAKAQETPIGFLPNCLNSSRRESRLLIERTLLDIHLRFREPRPVLPQGRGIFCAPWSGAMPGVLLVFSKTIKLPSPQAMGALSNRTPRGRIASSSHNPYSVRCKLPPVIHVQQPQTTHSPNPRRLRFAEAWDAWCGTLGSGLGEWLTSGWANWSQRHAVVCGLP